MNTENAIEYKKINDVDMTAAFITAGFPVLETETVKNRGRNRYEMLFIFEKTNDLIKASNNFVSGQLLVDAKTLLQNRNAVISMTKNGQFDIPSDG